MKYFNDAIIGNKNVRASFSNKGELLRLTYPNPEYKQFIDFYRTGVVINDSHLIYLHDDINNVYNQHYSENTNVLNTEIRNTYFNLKIKQTDFVPIKENVLVKKYVFTNENVIDLSVRFLVHSKLLTNDNNFVGARVIDNGMVQYTHDYNIATFSNKNKISSHQLNDCFNNVHTGVIQDKDYIGMSSDSSVCYDLDIIKPNENLTLFILLFVNDNKEKYKLYDIENEIERIKKIDYNNELKLTENYWRKYVKTHNNLELNITNEDYKNKIEKIYNRTILLYPLLTNESTGGIQAAFEVDEKLNKCGRYAYCWPRDAAFITKALDILKMEKETERFYKHFCKNTQSKNGMWEQRFYTDGRLAPCWGYQIDETASVIYGVFEHYERNKDIKFLKDNLRMMENALTFLEKYVDDILSGTNKLHVSYDLWEMCEGIHLYSLASIFSAYDCMIKMYDILNDEFKNNRLKQEQFAKQKMKLEKDIVSIKDFVLKNLYDNDRKCFLRNNKDTKMDISMLGAVVPFKMFSPKEKKVLNTVERINMSLRTYTGSYKRFEDDHYMNGNPWVIATLWMALYYIEIEKYNDAKKCLDFVVRTCTEHGFLAEQIDNDTMKPNWVIGLGWSHAMFVIVLDKLHKLGKI